MIKCLFSLRKSSNAGHDMYNGHVSDMTQYMFLHVFTVLFVRIRYKRESMQQQTERSPRSSDAQVVIF